jgi:capsular polysaccharide biosynthesis protein
MAKSYDNIVLKLGTPRFIKNIPGKILSILSGGAGNYNYWHWLFDVIPRIFLYEKFYLLKNINKIIIPDIKEKFQYQTLSLLGIKIKNCINSQVYRHIKFNELYVTSHPNLNLKVEKVPHWIIMSIKKKFLKKKFIKSSFPKFKKIYIDRSDSKSNVRDFRKIINEKLIKIFLASRGFKVIRLSEYSFIEQVNIFYNANCIIGLHGAGFANIVFCKKKAFVLEIKSNTTGDIIKNLAISNKLKYIGISLKPKFQPIGSQFGIVYLSLVKLKFLMIRNGIY